GKLAADCEAKAGADVFAAGAGVGLLECLENHLLLFGRDADTGIGELEGDHALRLAEDGMARRPACGRGKDLELHAAALGELERVRQQVLEHLLEPLGIRDEGAPERWIEVDGEPELPRLRRRAG